MVDHHRPSLVRFSVALLTAAALVFTGLPAAAQPVPEGDIADRLAEVPGLTVVEEKPTAQGFRYFVLGYTQYADHDRPGDGTFEQRLTLLHRGFDRPTVLQTSGYQVGTVPSRSEPTRLVDGNQISTEQRFFTPSRPDDPDWKRMLTIRQAAADHHRIIQAIDDIYTGAWISTGASKGGMTSVYHRRFYPDDLDGTVAYVAPNDVIDREDRAYLEFFETVGGDSPCQTSLEEVQRTALERRVEIVDGYEKQAAENGWTFDNIGGADATFEVLVLDTAWAFWQYYGIDQCAMVPPADAPTEEIVAFLDTVAGFEFYTDQGIEPYTPYYFQAATQLGTPSVPTGHVDDLLDHPGLFAAATYLPDDLPVPRYDHRAMIDIDSWVRTRGTELLFVNGEYDPWAAEPFRVGRTGQSRDAHVFTAPAATHGANISLLAEEDRAAATASLLKWAGVADQAGALRAPALIPGLDDVEDTERRPL
ncbi:S28 family serine protease [Nocardiopsis ansamitocini]|uniref:Tripeptidyl aminopeptidase n=1 Tax=Nocardiopsis ansamitocini TaxID=1670832 RepID=A0A9W6UJG3_9ACTN|nr:S28 family serine protease [Nocardiopsis ansamitocini]GLU48799.1 tripeptidyl aminopeptidase [Nocardiopsis ansamitocini]